ncbi:hypothetical protein IRJ41_005433, partial [Triplophysa rosa]
FAQHPMLAGQETRTKSPAPPTPTSAPQHSPAAYANPQPCLRHKKFSCKRQRLSADS